MLISVFSFLDRIIFVFGCLSSWSSGDFLFWGWGAFILSIYRFFNFLSCWLNSTVSATRLHILFFTDAYFQKTEHHLMKLCYVWFQLWLLKPSFGVQNLVGLSFPCIRKNVKKNLNSFYCLSVIYCSLPKLCVWHTDSLDCSCRGLLTVILGFEELYTWKCVHQYLVPDFKKKTDNCNSRNDVIGSKWTSEGA